MKTLNSTFANTFYAFFFFVLTVTSFQTADAQVSNQISSNNTSFSRTRSISSANYDAPRDRSFVIESKARPDLAFGFTQYTEKFANKLMLLSYVDGEYGRFELETGFGGTVRIKNTSNGQYLEIAEEQAVNGAMISQGEKRNSRGQQFQLVPLRGGFYALVSHMDNSLALEISTNGIDAPLVLNYRTGSDYQAFKLTK